MIRLAVIFARPCGGAFSHFAHFISDFTLPFYSILRNNGLLDSVLRGEGVTLEIMHKWYHNLGPMLPIARNIFPGLQVDYVSRFTQTPVFLPRRPWYNAPEHVEDFVVHLRRILPLKPIKNKVIIIERGLDRKRYPGGNMMLRSGGDRRMIGEGFDRLVARVKGERPDALHIIPEYLSFAEQVSIFLNADTLIGQHGAGFAHAHWMPKGGHLIELQRLHPRISPVFVPTIAKIRNHRWSVICYPCKSVKGCMTMTIGDATRVSRLLVRKSRQIPKTEARRRAAGGAPGECGRLHLGNVNGPSFLAGHG
jgi:hypothetical protein